MKRCRAGCVLLGISIALTILARVVTGFADWYYTYLYRPISTVFAWTFEWFPFSVVEILLYAILLYVVFMIVRAAVRVVSKKKRKRVGFRSGLQSLFLFISLICFLFVINCGVNYHKTSFADKEGFDARKYDKQELIDVCTILTERINELEPSLKVDEQGITKFDGNMNHAVKDAMQKLSSSYPSLKGYYPSPKGILISEILSYQDITGIYSPFTVEANVNTDMPEYMKPFTMCHELSHLKGIMREEEANFVGFLACINADEPTVRYSGYMQAYSYCMGELLNFDAESFSNIRKQLNEQANKDILNKHKFWEKYDTKIATISNKVNDVYLKANAQEEGTNSYNQVTGLILSYYKSKN